MWLKRTSRACERVQCEKTDSETERVRFSKRRKKENARNGMGRRDEKAFEAILSKSLNYNFRLFSKHKTLSSIISRVRLVRAFVRAQCLIVAVDTIQSQSYYGGYWSILQRGGERAAGEWIERWKAALEKWISNEKWKYGECLIFVGRFRSVSHVVNRVNAHRSGCSAVLERYCIATDTLSTHFASTGNQCSERERDGEIIWMYTTRSARRHAF